MYIKVYNKCLGREVTAGYYNSSTKVFYKAVSTHSKLLVLNAYGIEKCVVEELKKRGCELIRIKEVNTGNVFEIDFEKFVEKAILRTFGNSTEQYYLPLKYFTKVEKAS
ncbi:hypothetical protein [Caldicellulosiruptor acetigenus]|jgi:hypothetical protein|uniref:Uncharacterized protein n=1 Tax=Caldicellulosiruptor acetigenus 6A TaxID=632516 RepID=G2PUR1_9FIRM|nr:hypothetical protein [Caldicellulosiruptor acetigenus]AEM73572.1 hypothetical protein Calla_0930 [Caldicellulosiruptor acetigenus 6A]